MRLLAALLILSIPLAARREEDLEASVRRLAEVYALLGERLATPFDPQDALFHGAIPAMVRTLDPHSAFLDPEQFEALAEMQRSTEKGFGSIVSLLPGRVLVLQTLPDSPSARSGMSPGDEIVAVNGYPLAPLDMQQLAALLSQSRQQKVELLVRRPNFARLIPMTLVPEELADPSVQHAFFLEEGVGFVRVNNFEAETDRELEQAIEELGGRQMRGLVLDLRGNPGGVVEAAVRTAAMFLQPRQRILWIQGREGPQEEVRVPEDVEPYEFPVAILIDERTASAAELVVGALQDHDRATVVGERSFGKGLVQSVFALSEKTGLALTTALYLTPSGRPIQRSLNDCGDYQLTSCEESESSQFYETDAGRRIPGGGGIAVDQVIRPPGLAPFEAYLIAVNAFFDFAQQFVREQASIDESFEITPAILDDFQFFLSERGARVSLAEWTATLSFIRAHLKQEIFNLALGVQAGDKVQYFNDLQVRAALDAVKRLSDRSD